MTNRTAKLLGIDRLRRALSGAIAVVMCALLLVSFGALTFDSGKAEAATRSLKLYFTHTKESATIAFKRNGRYLPGGLRKINRFLRDWRRNEPTKMDPRLLDLVWEVYRRSGSRKPIQVISGYRSPKTNAALRRRGRKVARKSQHMRGKALDFYLPDVSIKKLRSLGLKAHGGGVGYYPGSFIHLDTGSVRYWPRMSRRQLAKIFPRGRTLHIPSDGRPMAGYQYARAKYGKRGRKATVLLASAKSSSKSSAGSFLKRIFGGDEGDDEEVKAATSAKSRNSAKKSNKATKSKRPRKGRKGDALPGVSLALAPGKESPKSKSAHKSAKPDDAEAPNRIGVPKLRPGSTTAPDILVASARNANKAVPLADRFASDPVIQPSQKPALKVEESRFALAATPEPSATERAAAALARSSPTIRPTISVAEPKNSMPKTAEQIKLALLGPARGIQIGENGASSKTMSTADIRNGSATEFDKTEIARVISETEGTSGKIMPVPVSAPRTASISPSQPEKPSRIDNAFAALSTTAGSRISVPSSKPQRLASLAIGATTPQARPIDMFGAEHVDRTPGKSARPPAGGIVTGAIQKKIRVASLMQLGDLNGNQVAQWAISRSTRVGRMAQLTAPRYIGALRIEPTIVLKDPFSPTAGVSRTNRFSGQAIKRLEFAKFITKELPKSKIVLVSRY